MNKQQLSATSAVFPHRLGLFAATLSAAIAVACGGGGGGDSTAGVGSGGTGFVTGFGSVIVDGVTYDDTALDTAGNVKTEDQTTDSAVDRSMLRIGQRLELELSDDGRSIRSAVIASELTGPVTTAASVGGTSFAVAGLTVNINTDASAGPLTVIEGASALSDFALGDRVEVHGDLTSSGAFLASRIERKPNVDANGDDITLVKVSGLVRGLSAADDNGNRTLQIGSLQVNVPSNAAITPTPASLANGQRVKVFGNFPQGSSTLTANAIRIKRFNQSRGDFRLRGLVTSVSQDGRSFVINGIAVDASGVSGLTTITVNRSYRVRGVYTASSDGSNAGTLRATEVKRSDDDEVRSSELKGSITDFVSASNFRVRGVLVDAQTATVTSGCTLANGQFVELRGAVASGSGQETRVTATTVNCRSTPASGSELKITDAVANLDTSARTFNLGSRLVSYANAAFEDGRIGDLTNNKLVEVEGRLNGTTLVARKIEFKGVESDDDNNRNEVEEREVEGFVADNATQEENGVFFTIRGVSLVCETGLQLCSTSVLTKNAKFEVRYNPTGSAPFSAIRIKRED